MAHSKTKMMSYREEKVGTAAVSVEKHDRINKVRIVAGKAVCKIITCFDEQDTGALYCVVESNRCDRFLLMTCHHVLPTNAMNEIQKTQLLFQEVQNMASVTLNRDNVKLHGTRDFWMPL